jgi:hypothetical protein
LTALVVLVAAGCAANPPAIQWQRTVASDRFGGWCVQQTTDGGFVVLGDSYPDSYPDEWCPDIHVLRTDSLGYTLWERTYGRSGRYDGAAAVKQTPDGGFVFSGYMMGERTVGERAVVTRLDSLGNVEWTDSGPVNGAAHDVEQTADGGYISVGSGEPGDSVYLRKLDAQGDREWEVGLPARQLYEWAAATLTVQQTSDRGYVTGQEGIIKTDSLGNVQWSRTYPDVSVLSSVRQTLDGGYIATSIASNPSVPWHKYNLVLLKTDAQGNKTWMRLYRGEAPSSGHCVRQTADGGYFVVGNSHGPYLVRTDAQGHLVWTWSRSWKEYRGMPIWGEQIADGGYIVLINNRLVKLAPEGQ